MCDLETPALQDPLCNSPNLCQPALPGHLAPQISQSTASIARPGLSRLTNTLCEPRVRLAPQALTADGCREVGRVSGRDPQGPKPGYWQSGVSGDSGGGRGARSPLTFCRLGN